MIVKPNSINAQLKCNAAMDILQSSSWLSLSLGTRRHSGRHSSTMSRHCARWTGFLALFPAWGDARFLSHQDNRTFIRISLWWTHSARTYSQHAIQNLSLRTVVHPPSPHMGYRETPPPPAECWCDWKQISCHKDLLANTCGELRV